MGHSARVETDMDKITIERETLELAASLIQPLTGKGDREVYDALRAALAAHPAEAQQEPVRDIIEGWKSATFGWNGTNPISYEKARADHAEECIRRIEAALTAQPAECGNTPYDEGPFTLAAQPADYAIGYADGFRDACKPARRIYMTAQPAPAATDINMPLPEPDGELTLRIIGREVQVDAYRTSTLIDYARDYAAAEVAKERERIRAAIMAKHEAANGQHNLYHCLAVELFGDEAIRAAAPPQCTSAPSEPQ